MVNLTELLNQLKDKKQQLSEMQKEEKFYRIVPQYLGELLTRYFRLEIEGTEHIPKTGKAIIAPNHSGYSGFDALVLSHEIFKNTHRVPRVLTHKFWFLSQYTAIPMQKLGFVEATKNRGLDILKKNKLLMLFPEGEMGNFKPTKARYHLQDFKRGFIRMAIQTGAPIIPTLVIGAEESHLNLARFKLTRWVKGLVIPLPINLIPLPARWKIIFLPPITLPYRPEAANEEELVHELASDIREKMQRRLSKEVGSRKSLFF